MPGSRTEIIPGQTCMIHSFQAQRFTRIARHRVHGHAKGAADHAGWENLEQAGRRVVALKISCIIN
jgi:hypothetical protein